MLVVLTETYCNKVNIQITQRDDCIKENPNKCNIQLRNRSFTLFKWKQLKWSRYRPGVTQRLGRGIALLFHDRGTRRGWMFSSTPRPHFTPGKDPVPFLQEAGWGPGPVWTGRNSRLQRDSIPDRPARSQSLYFNSIILCVICSVPCVSNDSYLPADACNRIDVTRKLVLA